MSRCVAFLLIALLGPSFAPPVKAAEPSWSPVIVATGSYGEKIRSMPIEKRPYRPLHFYGNTVRRLHYRGTAFPRVRSLGDWDAVGFGDWDAVGVAGSLRRYAWWPRR